MTIAEVLANEELRQREFPVTGERVFLAHAGVCPLPRRVTEAISAYGRLAATNDQEDAFAFEDISRARQTAAELLHARPEEIAFVGPTSLGLSLVAAGLRLR